MNGWPKVVNWSLRAIHDKLEIFEYWINRNKSKSYSEKLDRLFDKAMMAATKNPESGKKTDHREVRLKIIRHYLIFYRINAESLEVIRVWDARREKGKPKY